MATCPLCGEFEGSPPSVEGHISGKSDETHQGRQGFEFRGELQGEDETLSLSEVESDDEGSSGVAGEPVSGEAPSEDPAGDGESGAGGAAVTALAGALLVGVGQLLRSGGGDGSGGSGGGSGGAGGAW